jgi:hypothetical protein
MLFIFGGPGALAEVERHVADGGEVGRAVALAAATRVLAHDDVEDPMETGNSITVN